jgi:predicted HAD superfamily phosphohydrolase YqeG
MKYFKDLSLSHIKNHLIILDIDGTLVGDGGSELSEDVCAQIEKLKKNNDLLLCSNRKDFSRDAKISQMIKVDFIESPIRKPNKKLLNLIPMKMRKDRKLLVIGDKYTTDHLFAKNIGADFIKIKRVVGREWWIVKFANGIDDLIAKFFEKL